MTNYIRYCNQCTNSIRTQLVLINPHDEDIVTCGICGKKYTVEMKPVLKAVV